MKARTADQLAATLAGMLIGVAMMAAVVPDPWVTAAEPSVSGIATWYDYRRGHAAAGPELRRALGAGWRGTSVLVCHDGRCVRVVLSDYMVADRLIDLDARSFAVLAPLSRGVLAVTVTLAAPPPPDTSTKE